MRSLIKANCATDHYIYNRNDWRRADMVPKKFTSWL